MKSLYRHILLGVLLVLASCQVDDMRLNENVRIFASISSGTSTRVNDDGTAFTNGDEIKVVNTSRTSSNTAVYKYNSTDDIWTTEDVILWESGVENIFRAWYPASASYDSFAVPSDQTAGLTKFDWMTAESSADVSDGGVALSFNHHLSKVRIEITSWASEFAESERRISTVNVLTSSSILTQDGTSTSGNGESAFLMPYTISADQVYAALLAPGTYASGTEIISLVVGDGRTLTVQTADELTLIAGKAYTFKLNLGKSVIVLSEDNVSVRDWSDEIMDDQTFEEVVYQLPEGTPTSYELSFESNTLVLPLMANVASEVSVSYGGSETGWITYDDNMTKSGTSKEMTFNVASNKSASIRTATITLCCNVLDKSIVLNVSQVPFTGLDDSTLDKSKYITYVEDYDYYNSGGVFDCDIYYYGTTIYSNGLYRSSTVECKFALNNFTEGSFCISAGEYDDGSYEIYVNTNGLYIGSRCYTWADMGVSKTDVITLTLGGTTMVVNGKTITGLPSLNHYLDGYIWSGNYYDRDDGVYSVDYTFQDGGKIYYAKGWDSKGTLIYIGTGAITSTGRVCWKSQYYDNYSGNIVTQEHFPRVTSSFGRGNL